MGLANTAAYVTPPSGGPSCRLPMAASSPVTDKTAGRGVDPELGAGRLLAGSTELLASSLALRLPACWLGGHWEALGPPLGTMLLLSADTTIFFFFCNERAILSSLRRAGESCNVEKAFIKANTSCLRMVLGQLSPRNLPATPPDVAHRCWSQKSITCSL